MTLGKNSINIVENHHRNCIAMVTYLVAYKVGKQMLQPMVWLYQLYMTNKYFISSRYSLIAISVKLIALESYVVLNFFII